MNDERDYQTNPQSEEELKAARAVIKPDKPHGEEPKIIRVQTNRNPFDCIPPITITEEERMRLEVRKQLTTDLHTRITSKATQPGNGKDYTELYNELIDKYFAGITLPEFTNILEHHSTTPSTQAANWIGTPADAYRFVIWSGLTRPIFNKYFHLKIGRDLRHNDKDKYCKQDPFTELLSKHFDK
jgi:hypothetical protein